MENDEMTNDAAVAWIGPNGHLIDNARFQSRVDGMPDFGDLSGYQPLVPATTVAELRAQIAAYREADESMQEELARQVSLRRAAERRAAELERVCAEAYQVVGVLLSDTDQFDTDHGEKILDNLSEARIVHEDVLPWESKEARHG